MTLESQSSSLLWDSSNSPLQFRTSSQSNLPNYYDCSLVTPVRLTERKRQSQATVLHIPPVKLRSTMTWHSCEDDRLPTHTPLIMATDKEMSLFKQKFDRLRATLSVSRIQTFRMLVFLQYSFISNKIRIDFVKIQVCARNKII